MKGNVGKLILLLTSLTCHSDTVIGSCLNCSFNGSGLVSIQLEV